MLPKSLLLALQHCLPHHYLSSFAGWMARSKHPKLKNYLIRDFIERYQVNMRESARPAHKFKNFNDFFTRHLKADARPIDPDPLALTSPCDGKVMEAGELRSDSTITAKGRSFDLKSLLGSHTFNPAEFAKGQYAVIYLSPKDYHRVHMPYAGRLEKTTYVPGKLYSVNPFIVSEVDQVLARNERLVCHFATDQGPMVLIFVGAMIVSGIRTIWGEESKLHTTRIIRNDYGFHNITFKKGQEIGHFELGSTVIIICPWKHAQLALASEQALRVGEKIGTVPPPSAVDITAPAFIKKPAPPAEAPETKANKSGKSNNNNKTVAPPPSDDYGGPGGP